MCAKGHSHFHENLSSLPSTVSYQLLDREQCPGGEDYTGVSTQLGLPFATLSIISCYSYSLSDWCIPDFLPLETGLLAITKECPGGAGVKNLPANAGDTKDAGLVSGSGRSLGEGNGNPLQYSYLGNPMDRGAWQLQFVWLQSWTWLDNWNESCSVMYDSLRPHGLYNSWNSPG